MKTCRKCNQSKNESEFNRDTKRADGLFPWCRECCRISRGYNGRPRRHRPGKSICHPNRPARALQLCGECYGVWACRKPTVSMEEFIAFMQTRPKKCQICSKEEKLCMDHDHKTGKPRGFICTHCNTFLGLLEAGEEKGLLEKAMTYRNNPPFNNMPNSP